MFEKFNLKELLIDGFSEIMISPKKIYSITFHFFIPIVICWICIFVNITLDNDIISNTISSISIFSGLLFSVIFILTENYSKRKNDLKNNSNEESILYLERYKNFTKHITTLILFSVAVATISIVFLLLYLLCLKANLQTVLLNKKNLEFLKNFNLSDFKVAVLFILQLLSFSCLFNYLLTIMALVKEVYSMVFDDINYNS